MPIKFRLFFQHTFFQKVLTALLGKLANSRFVIIKNLFIRIFFHCYTINMSKAIEENPLAYPSFQDFFIRRL